MAARALTLLDHEASADFRRWSLAALIAIAAHLGLVATYLTLHSMAPQGAPDAPAVIVDMAPMPVAPASPMDVTPGPEMTEAQPPPEPVVQEEPPSETLVEPPPPEPVPPPPVVAMPEPPPPPPPEPEVKPEPKPEPPPEPVKAERKKPAPRTTAAPRSDRQTADRPAAPSPGAAGTQQASWRDLVVSQLQRAKRYPRGAESRREQGVVTLSFTLSRNGSVLSRSIARGSGNSEFDNEVLDMVQRAAPFPPFPPSMSQASVHLSVPIRFSLR